jgi:PAS domain S-box-containing protein
MLGPDSDHRPLILNVDDDPVARAVVSVLLRQTGFEVEEASWDEETSRLAAREPDLVLLDVNLGAGMDGLEVCRRLKADPVTATTPVMLISAISVRTEDRVRALEEGADGYLTKPIDPADLVAHLKALLRLRGAAEARQVSESRFRAIIEKSFDAVVLLAADGTLLYASPSQYRVLGYAPEEWVGRNTFDLVHPDDRAEVVRLFAALLATPGGSDGTVHRALHKDGSWRWVETRGTNLLEDPAVRAVVVNYRDITQQRLAQEAVARQAHLLSNVRDSVIVTDLDGVVTFWNEGATRLFGWTAEEMLGRPLTDRVPEAARPRMAEKTQAIAAGEEFVGEWEDYRRDGSRVWIDARVSRITGPSGEPAGILGLAHDITERRRLEEQLRQSQKMEAIGQLAGGVAHDFNNLMTVITGYSDLLLSDPRVYDHVREQVLQIQQAGQRAASLTRQLLAFGRKQVLAPALLDLNKVVSEMGKLLHRTIGEDIELVLHPQPGLALIHADQGQIEQVILNLAVNARDAMPRGGRLVVQTGNVDLDEVYARRCPEVTAGSYALLELRDNGYGMTADVKAHIFEPFFTTKGVGKGTGLGLAVVHGVVSQSGGHIEVDSEPGRGTSFKIYLPRAQPTSHPTTSAAQVKVSPGGHETVLLVEDAQAVREVNSRILVQRGYVVLEACDGQEALRVAGQHRGPIHLLLTDVVMPAMGGRQLVEQLSALHPEMKVLYVSGYPDDAVLRHGVREGEVNFLQKPFSPLVLAQKVRDVLDTPSPSE